MGNVATSEAPLPHTGNVATSEAPPPDAISMYPMIQRTIAPEHGCIEELDLQNAKRRRLAPKAQLLDWESFTPPWGQDEFGKTIRVRPETKQQRRMRHLEVCEQFYASNLEAAKEWWSLELQRERRRRKLTPLRDGWYQALSNSIWGHDNVGADIGDDPHYWFPLWFMKMHRAESVKSSKERQMFIINHGRVCLL